MKAILMSIRPRHNKNILNGIKLWEIRKKFPRDYIGWVYIYCTKGKDMLCYRPNFDGYTCVPNLYGNEHFNGKVIARFWCDRVEEIQCDWSYAAGNCYTPETFYEHDLLTHSCLSYTELDEYLLGKNGYAIHITNLEIFDSPKPLSAFDIKVRDNVYRRRKAPQSWCYIEV